MTGELVTVVLPVYNGMPFLPEAVDSILAQTLKDFRLLVIDGGSTDGSLSYLESISDPRVALVHQQGHGLGATLNQGIDLCETEYLARMDADDVALPERLEKQLAFMEADREVVMVGTQVAFLCNGQIVPHAGNPLDHAGIVRVLMKGSAGVSHPSLMCRTYPMRRIGGYRIAGAGEDLDFCLRMCEMGRAANTSEVLHYYRLHGSSLAVTQWHETRRAYSYAIHCAKRRRLHQPEPDFKEFCVRWDRWALLHQLAGVISAWGCVHYRKGILNLAEGHTAKAMCSFIVAALVRPQTALRRGRHIMMGLLKYPKNVR